MVEIGSVIQARVERIEPYGVFLKYETEKVFVHLPEVSWQDLGDPGESVQVDDILGVYVLRYHYLKREIVGSIRRLHPEQNPYRQLSRLPPGEVLRGQVKSTYRDGATVVLPNGARGHVPRTQVDQHNLKPGDEALVNIAALEVDEGCLTLAVAPEKTTPGKQPLVPTLAATQT